MKAERTTNPRARGRTLLPCLALFLCMAVAPAWAATCTWGGGGGDNNASTDLNWVEGGAPSGGEDIVLDATTNKNMTWDMDIDVASWTQAGYTGTVTIGTAYSETYGDTDFVITGDCVISNGTWKHRSYGSAERYRLRVSVGGHMTIGPDGSIDVSNLGWGSKGGPGGTSGVGGGTYGGQGNSTVAPYGSPTAPVNLGSGGWWGGGGGAIYLTVQGAFTNDGAVVSSTDTSYSLYGSGGSIYITSGSLAGNGTFSVQSGGGGGRIAVVVTNTGADFSSFSGEMNATAYTGSGTIYLETQADNGKGELIVNGNNKGQVTGLDEPSPGTYEFSRITLTNKAALRVMSSNTLVATNTAFVGDGTSGMWLYGAELQTPANFAYSNIFIGIRGSGTALNPSSSLTLATNGILYVDVPHSMTCAVIVAEGGMISHTENGDAEHYAANLSIDGSLTTQPGGGVDVTGKGYTARRGPGGVSSVAGGSYGGQGSGLSMTYGSVVTPTNSGSAGWNFAGGGIVTLRVSGPVTNNGVITANAAAGNVCGSGGSIWLTCGSLHGSGNICANGDGNGGGGRIALAVTNADAAFSSFSGAIEAYGENPGGAGTVYFRLPDEGLYGGTLIVDNNGVNGYKTLISSQVVDAAIGDLIIRNGGNLSIAQDQALSVSGIFSNNASFSAEENGAVIFTGGVGSTSTIYNTTTFMDLVCTNAGKTLVFEAGETFIVDELGLLHLAGSDSADVVLRSTATSSAWYLNISNSAARTVSYVDVWDSDASGGAAIVANDSTGERTVNWTFAAAGETNTWDGSSSTAWGTDANWSLDHAPTADDIVIIPTGLSRYPVLDASKTLAKLTIENGAALALAGFDLTVNANVAIQGAMVASASETITLKADVDLNGATLTAARSTLAIAGSGDQLLDLDDLTFCTIDVQNSAGTVTFTNGFTAWEFKCESASGSPDLTFGAGQTYAVRDFVVLGSEATTNVTLSSTSPGTQWDLVVSGYAYVRGVDVTDSDADLGKAIYPLSSADGGQNDNWTFGANWVTWLGTTDTDFHKAANWSPPGVPDATSRLLVDTNNAMTINSPVTVLSLLTGGSQDPVMTIGRNLTVIEDVVLLDGATLNHTANTTTEANKMLLVVSNDLVIDVGAAMDVEGKGYSSKTGPGAGTLNGQGASHGGYGRSNPNVTYGSFLWPTNLGSGAWNRPGSGAIRVNVSGAAMIDGAINAEGPQDIGFNSGSGGSIRFTAGSLTGIGTIKANGGAYAGGGRVAMFLTDTGASVGQFTGMVTAYGGNQGGAGTVYVENEADDSGEGTVTIDNNGASRYTDVPPALYYEAGEVDDVTFVVTNGAMMRLTDDFTVGDIWLGPTATLDLNNLTLTVRTREHPLDGSVINEGEILWVPDLLGTVFVVR